MTDVSYPHNLTSLDELRAQIDVIDAQILDLFVRRAAVATEIGLYKRTRGLPIVDHDREQQKLDLAEASVPEHLKASTASLMRVLMGTAKSQEKTPDA